MPDLCHYETSTDTEFSVACGASVSSIRLITEHLPLVTCPLCLNAVAHPGTDARPSDRAKLRQIKQVLAEWEQGAHSDADALAIITGIIDKEGPDHGKEAGS